MLLIFAESGRRTIEMRKVQGVEMRMGGVVTARGLLVWIEVWRLGWSASDWGS